MPTLERARAKHNEIVAALAKTNDKKDKALDALIRIEAKRTKLIRAVTRSQRRLDILVTAATHTNGPTATVKPDLIKNVDGKATPALKDDTVHLADLHKTKQGKANAESWNAIPAVAKAKPKRKSRRTPDDFKSEMAEKKTATD